MCDINNKKFIKKKQIIRVFIIVPVVPKNYVIKFHNSSDHPMTFY